MQKKGVCKMDSSYRWSIITIETPTFAKEPAIQYYSKQEAKSDIQPINANYKTIEAFMKIFTNLKVSCRMGKKAPHKYILLISVFNLIGCGIIKSRRFGSSIEIEKEFMRNWNLYVPSDIPFNAIYTTPFWHMMSEPFWILYDKNGDYITNQWKNSITSIKKQRKEITAEITEELFELIQNNSTRELFISHLINCINLGLSE
jgi:putative restriction endonuclease